VLLHLHGICVLLVADLQAQQQQQGVSRMITCSTPSHAMISHSSRGSTWQHDLWQPCNGVTRESVTLRRSEHTAVIGHSSRESHGNVATQSMPTLLWQHNMVCNIHPLAAVALCFMSGVIYDPFWESHLGLMILLLSSAHCWISHKQGHLGFFAPQCAMQV
jgi:hypothetical protein